jgi:hypothetical protein
MLRAAAASLLLLTLCVLPARGSQEPALAEVLKRAALYVANFQKQLSGIVAEETYEQHIKKQASGDPLLSRRRLKSDLLLVRPVGSGRYVEFRDVFEVDGRAVRDRQDRLTTLFLDPPPGAQSQLERVASESARFNIGRVFRTMNTPVLPLAFLHADYQPQFTFTLVRDPATAAMAIAFKETGRPTLVRTPGGLDMPARGRFWVDTATGAVTRSEFIVEDMQVKATVNVTYRGDEDLAFLVPVEMREEYVAGRDVIEGRATYDRFRKFQVNVDEQIKPVKQ